LAQDLRGTSFSITSCIGTAPAMSTQRQAKDDSAACLSLTANEDGNPKEHHSRSSITGWLGRRRSPARGPPSATIAVDGPEDYTEMMAASSCEGRGGPATLRYTRLGDPTYGRGKSIIAMMQQSHNSRSPPGETAKLGASAETLSGAQRKSITATVRRPTRRVTGRPTVAMGAAGSVDAEAHKSSLPLAASQEDEMPRGQQNTAVIDVDEEQGEKRSAASNGQGDNLKTYTALSANGDASRAEEGLQGAAETLAGTLEDEEMVLEDLVDEEEDYGFAEEDLTLKRDDYLHIVLAAILPGALAVIPVLMPFGNPFAKDGDNSIATNWAYYFWYTPIGWAYMWIKITLWNCELWDRDFFFPFMHSRPESFSCNSTLIAVFNSTAFAVLAYCTGYLIFHNPIPLGTLCFGAPCFIVFFINMYLFVVPSQCKQTLSDHFKIFRCWAPFVFWVAALGIYMGLIWVQSFLVSGIQNKYLYIIGNISTQLAFVVIRESFALMPLEWFMGDQHMDLSMLWNLGYSAMCSTMSDWIFPGIPTDAAGLTSTAGIISMNFALGWYQFSRSTDPSEILVSFLNSICDVISGWAFLFIFIYNAFGPNQHVIFMIREFNTQQKLDAVVMILINFSINAVRLALMFRAAGSRYDPQMQKALKAFGLTAMRQWFWLVMWLLVSTCLACGACMVMMHDGMDFSFSFERWHGTWPFVSHHHTK